MTNVIEQIQLADLEEEQKQLAELIGLDNFKLLLNAYGGVSIYIPKPDSFAAVARNESIREDFNGYNFKELARKYNLTEVWIRSIVSDKAKEIKAKPIDGQLNIFNLQTE